MASVRQVTARTRWPGTGLDCSLVAQADALATARVLKTVLVLVSIPVVLRTGTEFMPPLDEGSLLMMPTTLPDVSYTEAKRILQVLDQLLKSFPEVENVLGKAGRANTAPGQGPAEHE
ncbi:efflux RND transporter permease subunit [Hymenobacter humi]|uniref:Efflux RND transporter permease subunit n=1 Tax=Hymenobacter humi TaxID=1411620 RepID=A0ABW2UEF9_9BACT